MIIGRSAARALLGIAFSLSAATVTAGDLPVPVPSGAAAMSSGNFYVWAEGPWAPVRAPDAETIPDLLSADSLNASPPEVPVLFGAPQPHGMRGGIGYVLPDGSLPSTLGSRVRVEFGANSTSASVAAMPGNRSAAIGNRENGVVLGGCDGCEGPLAANYSYLGTSVKAANDVTVFGRTVSPSIAVFNSRGTQDFIPSAPADAAGALSWEDWGAKFGLESKFDLAPAMTLNLGVGVGVARRAASLASTGEHGVAAGARHADTTPLVGNAEARLSYKPAEVFEFNSYAGMKSYDSRTPGLVSGGASPEINFTPEAGYYAGAGATYRFGR